MSFGDLPYKSVKLHTRREYEKFGPDTLQVIEGKHHLIGYTGHVHANQVSRKKLNKRILSNHQN
jgi:hypothetical protein